MNTTPEMVTITVDDLIHETDAAWLFDVAGSEVWLPKSNCEYTPGRIKTVEVPEWLAIDKGLV